MRGDKKTVRGMFDAFDIEDRIAADHPDLPPMSRPPL